MPDLASKKKWKIQRPDGSIVQFWGPRGMALEDLDSAAQAQSDLDRQKKDQKKFDLADRLFPQTNSGMGSLAAGFSDFMNTPLLPEAQSGEEYFRNAQPAAGGMEAAGQGIQGFGRDLYNDVVRPLSSPTGIAAAAVPGGMLSKAARPAATLATKALPGLMSAAAAPGAVMDVGQAIEDPSMANVTGAMSSVGNTVLGGALSRQMMRPRPIAPQPRPVATTELPAINPQPFPGGLSDVNPDFGMGRINQQLEVARQQRQLPADQYDMEPRVGPSATQLLERGSAEPLPDMPTVEGVEFGKERRSRSERLQPEVLEQSRAQASEEGFKPRVVERPTPISDPGGETAPAELPPERKVERSKTPAPTITEDILARKAEPPTPFALPKKIKGQAMEGFPDVTYEGEGMGGELYKYGGKEGNNFSTKPGASQKEFLDSYFNARKGYESRIANETKKTPAPTPEPTAPITEPAVVKPVEPTTEIIKPEIKTAQPEITLTTEQLKPKDTTAFEPRTIGEHTVELSGDPKLPYQLRKGETVISKGLKDTSFDAYLKRESDFSKKMKEIDDKYRDVDDEPSSDIPDGFQEEKVPTPSEAEREAMRTVERKASSRTVERPSKKKDERFPLIKKKPKEAGFLRFQIPGREGDEISDLTKKRQDLMTPITDVIAGLGKSGKEIARLMTRGRLVGEHYSGTWEQKAQDALENISDEEFGAVNKDNKVLKGNIIDVLEGKASPANEKIRIASEQIRDILDEGGLKAESSGMSLRVGDKNVPFEKRANYFPHLYTEKFWQRVKNDSKFRERILERIVNQNPGMTLDAASKSLNRARQFGERLIDPQHERVFNLPGWERSKGALFKHIHDMGRQIGNAEELGPKDIAGSKLDALIKQTKDPEYAYELLKRAMKRDEPSQIRDIKIANKITTAASWAYLSRAAIGNMAQLTRVPAHASFSSAAKAFRQYLSDRKGFYKEGLNSGAIVEIGAKGLMEEFGSKSHSYKMYGIEQSEKFLRSIASAAGRSEAEAAFRVLKKNPDSKSARVQLADLLQEDVDSVIKQDKLTPKQSAIAGGRMAELTQGRAEAMDLPKNWSGSPYANLYFLYKKYALQDTRNMWKAIKKNPVKALATIAVLNQAAGEVVGDIKEALKGLGKGLVTGDISGDVTKKVSERGTYINKDNPELGRFFDNYLQSWTFGVLSDALQNLTKGEFAGTVGEMAGDITGTIGSTVDKAYKRVQGTESRKASEKSLLEPLAKTATGMLPVLGPGIREGMFPKEEPKKRKGPPRRVVRQPARRAP